MLVSIYKNGQCQNMFGSYICICPPGYRIDQSQQEIQCVGKICKKGQCQNTFGSYIEDIQMVLLNMAFISSHEVETMNEISICLLHK